MDKLPPLEECIDRLKLFIGNQGLPTQLLWVFPRNCTSYGRHVWIVPLRNEKEALVAQYQLARDELGIALTAFASDGKRTFCSIYAPTDHIDAQYRLIGGLKLSVLSNPTEYIVSVLQSRIKFGLRKLANRIYPRNYLEQMIF